MAVDISKLDNSELSEKMATANRKSQNATGKKAKEKYKEDFEMYRQELVRRNS